MNPKRIKEEMFLFQRLVSEGFGPKYWGPYFRNRFFWKKMIQNLPIFDRQANDGFELHFLCQAKDVWMMVWALASFLYFSETSPKVILHDDGTLSQEIKNLLKIKFKNLSVIDRKEADEYMVSKSNLAGKALEYRMKGHVLNMKLIDSIVFSRSPYVMICDTDILFFSKPDEIVNFVNNKSVGEALVAGQSGSYPLENINSEYVKSHDLINKKAGFINGGLQIIKKDFFTTERVMEYYENTKLGLSHYFTEALGWCSILGQTDFKTLPLDRYHIKGKPNNQTIAKHFTSPRRYELYAYGIDMVKNRIDKKPAQGK